MGLFFALTFIQNSIAQYTNSEAEKIGWRLSVQAYTFKEFTFLEAIDKIKVAGSNYIEMYPGQTIGSGFEGKTNLEMSTETREKLLAIIKSKGLKIVNFGVTSAKTQEEWVKQFEFAKFMGIETIITEADSMQLNYIEPLCEKYQIRIALHNHPDPSFYWNPDFAMKQIANRNKYIGLCTDLGHWLRAGLNPLESLKKCEGRVFAIHAKDLVKGEGGMRGYHDVPWGTGLINFSGLMHELKRQGYKGTITVEYEYNWLNSLPEVKESVDYFNRLTNWIGKE